jgi:hypothetical protein
VWAADGAHVRRFAHARNRRTAQLLRRDEAMLVHHALTLSFGEFSTAIDYWSLHADPDGAEQSDLDRRDRRRVTLDQTLAGMWSGTMLLDPISGAIVAGELERLEQAMFDADRNDAKTRLGRDPRVGELARSADQRRADALVEMARRSTQTAAGDGGVAGRSTKPLFTLVLGNDAFSHLCQLASGQVLSPEAILPWIGQADLERILFAQGPNRSVAVSHKRTFTGALRRLIEVRDQLCYHEYCDIPAHRCQIDHIIPWTAGGPTSLDNGRLACGYHNRLRHRRRPPP